MFWTGLGLGFVAGLAVSALLLYVLYWLPKWFPDELDRRPFDPMDPGGPP